MVIVLFNAKNFKMKAKKSFFVALFILVNSTFVVKVFGQNAALMSFNISMVNNSDSIELSLTNHFDFPILVSNPKFWLNATPNLMDNGYPVQIGFRVKADVRNYDKFVEILPQQTYSTKYGYSLKRLYGHAPDGELSFSFNGKIKDDKGQLLFFSPPNIPRKLLYDKPIISNVVVMP